MPAPLIPKEQVLVRLTAAFRQFGYDGASIAQLSKATGLGKASLYHYFPGGKVNMARAVLEHLGIQFGDLVLSPLHAPTPPPDRLNRMILGLSEFFQQGRTACVFELFAVGQLHQSLGPAIATAVSEWQNALADVVCAAGVERRQAQARAEDAIIAVEGALVVSRVQGTTEPFQRTLAELPGRLLSRT